MPRRSPYENRIQNLILFGLLFVVCAIADVVQNWAMEKVAVVRTADARAQGINASWSNMMDS
mgnify:FL=1